MLRMADDVGKPGLSEDRVITQMTVRCGRTQKGARLCSDRQRLEDGFSLTRSSRARDRSTGSEDAVCAGGTRTSSSCELINGPRANPIWESSCVTAYCMRMHQGLSSAACGRFDDAGVGRVVEREESSVHEVVFSQSHVTASRHVVAAWHLQSEILVHLPLKCRRSDIPNLKA